MKLYAIRISVDDLAAARRFYGETLGLPVKWDYGVAVGYDVGADLIVELNDGSEPDHPFAARFVGCSLQVDNIEATYRDLAAKGVEFLGPPEKMDWGGTLAHFRDAAGNVLTLLG